MIPQNIMEKARRVGAMGNVRDARDDLTRWPHLRHKIVDDLTRAIESHKLPRFEWIDESTGLHCPSLVCVADHGDDSINVKDMPILRTKQISSFGEMYLPSGRLDKRKLPKISGYRPQASIRLIVPHGQAQPVWYALLVTYVPTE